MSYLTEAEKKEIECIKRESGDKAAIEYMIEADMYRFMRGEPSHVGDVIGTDAMNSDECTCFVNPETGYFEPCSETHERQRIEMQKPKRLDATAEIPSGTVIMYYPPPAGMMFPDVDSLVAWMVENNRVAVAVNVGKATQAK